MMIMEKEGKRMHLYDLLGSLEVNPDAEIRRLNTLLFSESIDIDYRSYSLVNIINQYFRDFNTRRTFINFEDMLNGVLPKRREPFGVFDLDDLILFSELILTTFDQLSKHAESHTQSSIGKECSDILNNIRVIAEKLNYEIYQKGDYFYIAPLNLEVAEAVEVTNDETAIELLHYNHRLAQGNLKEKRRILLALGNHLEPLLKDNLLKKNGYSNLQNDIGFYLNNFSIRHNNSEGTNKKAFITEMSEEQLEEWYDKAYNTIIMCLIAEKQISCHDSLVKLKQDNGL